MSENRFAIQDIKVKKIPENEILTGNLKFLCSPA